MAESATEFKEPFMRESRNRVIIGLGGQGSKIVNAIVTEMKKEIGLLPENVRFVAIDTDREDIEENVTNGEITKIGLDVSDREAVINRNRWLPSAFLPLGGEGAGMHRCIGKAVYITKKPQIKRELDDVFYELVNTTHSSDFFVILVTALGGGTGSSMIIELALEIKETLRNRYNDPFIIGIGILTARDDEDTNQLANCYASLKELHYLMSINEPVTTGRKRICNPYKIFFLVSRQIRGVTRDKEMKESLIHFLMDVGFVSTRIEEDTRDKMLDPNDLWTRATGHEHQFSTLGYFRFMFPYHRLDAYFRAELALSIEERRLRKLEYTDKAKEDKIRNIEEEILVIQKRIDELSNLSEGTSRGFLTAMGKEFMESAIESRDLGVKQKGTMEQEMKLLKEQVQKSKKLQTKIEERIQIARRRKVGLYHKLLRPEQSPHLYTVRLSEEEIDFLRERREDLQYSHLKEIMEWLGRGDEYYRNTHETVATAEVVRRPMLNYHFTFSSMVFGENMHKDFMEVLMKSGLVTPNRAGLLDFSDPTGGEIMLFLATYRNNYDMSRLNMASFQENAKMNYAKGLLVKPLRIEETKRYYFDVYLFIIGLRPWSPLPNELPPRLEEFRYIEPVYKEEVQSHQILKHHSLFLGNPAVYKALVDDEISFDGSGNTEDVLRFWASYVIIDEDTKWFLVFIILLKIELFCKKITRSLSLVKDSLVLLNLPEDEPAGLEGILDGIDKFLESRRNTNDVLPKKHQELIKYSAELRYYYNLISNSKEALNREKVVGLIDNLTSHRNGELVMLISNIDQLIDCYNGEFFTVLNNIQDFINSIKDRVSGYEHKAREKFALNQIDMIKEQSVEDSLVLEKMRTEVIGMIKLIELFGSIRALELFVKS